MMPAYQDVSDYISLQREQHEYEANEAPFHQEKADAY
jgi:hypothetical protein